MAYLDPALLLTMTPLLRGLSGVSYPRAIALLEELSYAAMMSNDHSVSVNGCVLHSREFDELFADGPDHRARVTPAGAKLLVELYELGVLPYKPGAWTKAVDPLVREYIALDPELAEKPMTQSQARRRQPCPESGDAVPATSTGSAGMRLQPMVATAGSHSAALHA